jgi:hypothetical protein
MQELDRTAVGKSRFRVRVVLRIVHQDRRTPEMRREPARAAIRRRDRIIEDVGRAMRFGERELAARP